jgi:hypothetical protein
VALVGRDGALCYLLDEVLEKAGQIKRVMVELSVSDDQINATSVKVSLAVDVEILESDFDIQVMLNDALSSLLIYTLLILSRPLLHIFFKLLLISRFIIITVFNYTCQHECNTFHAPIDCF